VGAVFVLAGIEDEYFKNETENKNLYTKEYILGNLSFPNNIKL